MNWNRAFNVLGGIALLILFAFVVALAWDTGATLHCLDQGICHRSQP